jgi:(2Fe-2S) ferredoxin
MQSTNAMKKLLVCTNFRANPNKPSCAARGSKAILASLQQQNLMIEVAESPCMGFCEVGPNAHLTPSGAFLHGIQVENLSEVIKQTNDFLKENS